MYTYGGSMWCFEYFQLNAGKTAATNLYMNVFTGHENTNILTLVASFLNISVPSDGTESTHAEGQT